MDIATSNFRGDMMWWVLGNILCNHDPKVKVKNKKEGICDGIDGTPSTAVVVARCQLWEQF